MTDTPKLSTPRLRVVMADGAEHEIQIYNREMLAWDRARARRGWPQADQAPFVWLTFLAWSGLSREGTIPKMSLDDFEQQCLEVGNVTDDDGKATNDAADPTPPDPELT